MFGPRIVENHDVEVVRMLADRWQDAANEASCPTLRDCYAKRAARYREMAVEGMQGGESVTAAQ